jgi:nonsense-mediated mRNA decay protein 3
MPRICPKCGKETASAEEFSKGFCIQCYFAEHPLITLRQPPTITICPKCDAYWSGGRWNEIGSKALDEHVYYLACDVLDTLLNPSQPASVEIQLLDEPESPISRMKKIRVEVTAEAKEQSHKETESLTIPITPILCERCKRSAGGYFEATLQIRAASGKLSRNQEEQVISFLTERQLALELPPNAMKLSQSRGGIDIKFLSSRIGKKLAKDLANELGLILSSSSKVTGRTRDGKTQTRETYAVRFPPFKVGDVIEQREKIYFIANLRKGRYHLTDLATGHHRSFSPEDFVEGNGQLLNDHVFEFQVISETNEFYQLMRQEDYSIFDLPKPEKAISIGSILQVLLWKERLYLIPKTEA